MDSLSSNLSGCGSEDCALGFSFVRRPSKLLSPSQVLLRNGYFSTDFFLSVKTRGLYPTPVSSIPPHLVTCTTRPKPQPQEGGEEDVPGGEEEALHGKKHGGLQTEEGEEGKGWGGGGASRLELNQPIASGTRVPLFLIRNM